MANTNYGYAKLSNQLWRNDKACDLLDTDPRAFGVWIMAISYCSDNLTDGVLTERALRRLGVDDLDVAHLIEAGFLDVVDEDSYAVHDYLDINTSAERVREIRQQTADRVSRHRQKRRGKAQDGVTDDSENECNALHNAFVTLPKEKEKEKENQKENQNINTNLDRQNIGVANPKIVAECTQLGIDIDYELTKLTQLRAIDGTTSPLTPSQIDGWLQQAIVHHKEHPPKQPKQHQHTWKCEHTNDIIGRTTPDPDDLACHVAQMLNDGLTESEILTRIMPTID